MEPKTLNKQQRKVYEYVLANPGCTTKDIRDATWVQCPTGRMSEMRAKGIVFKEVGHKQYPGAQPFKCYEIEQPAEQLSLI